MVAEAMGWPWGLESEVKNARGFYAAIAAAMLLGTALDLTPINPIKALFYSAVLNGVVAVPLIVIIVLLASRPAVMGRYTANGTLKTLAWATAVVMGIASIGMLLPAST
jgi:Mn2+/Fe2+ NRAMP family transporter